MRNIKLIIAREFKTRIRKKSFWITTAIGPLTFLAMLIVPIWLSTADLKEMQTIVVIDETHTLASSFQDAQNLHYSSQTENASTLATNHTLIIPMDFPQTPAVLSASLKDPALVEWTRLNLRAALFEDAYPLYKEKNLLSHSMVQNQSGSQQWVAQFIGYGSAIFIYFFIFLYGMQVMKGVVEEKNNRIVEVMLSSVRPFDLMVGKISGIGLLGVTQVLIWIVAGGLVGVWFFEYYQLHRFTDAHILETSQIANTEFALQMNQLMSQLSEISIPAVVGSFVFFFIVGYLIYGALFAIVGAASNPETETQQFIFPISLPLIIGVLTASAIVESPNSTMAHVLSYIPFTAPITTSIRVPFAGEIPGFALQWTLSALSAVLCFLGTTWISAKIYEVGILLYGQKVGYAQIFSWLRRK